MALEAEMGEWDDAPGDEESFYEDLEHFHARRGQVFIDSCLLR